MTVSTGRRMFCGRSAVLSRLRTPSVQNGKVKVCLVIFVHTIQRESAITQHWHENTNLAQSITDKSFLVFGCCEESAFSAEDFLMLNENMKSRKSRKSAFTQKWHKYWRNFTNKFPLKLPSWLISFALFIWSDFLIHKSVQTLWVINFVLMFSLVWVRTFMKSNAVELIYWQKLQLLLITHLSRGIGATR